MSGPNALDKERSLLNDDPKWQDTNYVLTNYKTEQCKKPPRLCRQGYACPQYHNSRDRRRSPKKFKYRYVLLKQFSKMLILLFYLFIYIFFFIPV